MEDVWEEGTSCSQIPDTLATSSSVEAENYRSFFCVFLAIFRVIGRGCSLSQRAVGGRQEHIWYWLPIHHRIQFTSLLSRKGNRKYIWKQDLMVVFDLLLNCPLIRLALLSSNWLVHHLHIRPDRGKIHCACSIRRHGTTVYLLTVSVASFKHPIESVCVTQCNTLICTAIINRNEEIKENH